MGNILWEIFYSCATAACVFPSKPPTQETLGQVAVIFQHVLVLGSKFTPQIPT
jgi:hypothetical protein